VTKSRLRNLALPLGLAALAAILIGIYVVSYRNSVTHGAKLVTVVVATRDIPAGTDGATIAGGGYLKSQTVVKRSVVPGAVISATPLTSKVTATEIYKGQQITLRQFVPMTQGGIFAKFSGNQRVISIAGDANQLLAGTLSDGDHVDVVTYVKYHVKIGNDNYARASTRIVLRNILVLTAPDGAPKAASVGGPQLLTAELVLTDNQAQTMGWAMKGGTWFFALRPTNKPLNSKPSIETTESFLGRGLRNPAAQVIGGFPGSFDAP
jgi:Flp pilus assembly protein CpaB